MEKLVLHEDPKSGNCYKVRLTAAHLRLPLERRFYDIMKGETRTPRFLAEVNANGRIPVLQIGGRFIPESNAACHFLAAGSDLIPDDPFDHADMLRWMFWEQYNHEPNVATLRFWLAYIGEDRLSETQRLLLPMKREAGDAALRLMDEHLGERSFFVADRFGLADIALYAYTHVAGAGGFDLSAYPALRAWMERIAAVPGHIAMD